MKLESIVQTLIKIATAGAGAGYIEEAQDVLVSLEKALPDCSSPCIALVNTKLLDRDFDGAQKLVDKYKKVEFDDNESGLLSVMEVFIKMMNDDIDGAAELLGTIDVHDHPVAQRAMSMIAKQVLNAS